jgi:hypothetical protein
MLFNLNRLRRDQTFASAVNDIGIKLRRDAIQHGQPSVLNRLDFLDALSKINIYEHAPMKQMSLIFSVFDPLKKNYIRYADFLSALTVLDRPADSAIEKLSQIWRINEDFGGDKAPLELALTVLCTCCASDEECNLIKNEFYTNFRPACFRASFDSVSYEDDLSQSVDKLNSTSSSRGPSQGNRMRTIQPAYTICDQTLDGSMFIKLMKKSPDLLKLFDSQLSSRLILCYGKDSRAEESLSEEVQSSTLNKSNNEVSAAETSEAEAPMSPVIGSLLGVRKKNTANGRL